MKSPLLESIKKELKKFANSLEEVQAVYIYGSSLKKSNPNDIDVLVIVEDDANPLRVLEQIHRLSKEHSIIHFQNDKK